MHARTAWTTTSWTRCLAISLLSASCGGSAGTIVPGSERRAAQRAYPARLAATVQRSEEQGIDYASTATMSFELTLDARGGGDAVRTERGTDVLGSDVHRKDSTLHYSASARWESGVLVVSLAATEPSPLAGQGIVLRCERWTTGMRVEGPVEVADRALPGVDWTCALPTRAIFLLGRVGLQNVPRSGEFLLLGEGHTALAEESVSQAERTIVTRRAD